MQITLNTTCGNIVLRLYDDTPQHRDNFVKLAQSGYFDNTLFHRVIKDFMIQGGDPDSVNAPQGTPLGTGGPDYTLPAEIHSPQLFHRRGALCAARTADSVNPERRSSGSQFYIVWGKVYKPAQLRALEQQMCQQYEQNLLGELMRQHRDQILELRRERNLAGLHTLQNDLQTQARQLAAEQGRPQFTPEQTQVYTTQGGTPFLDGQYTVFGCVEEGLDVVERIVSVPTHRNDRPKDDVKILSVTVQ